PRKTFAGLLICLFSLVALGAGKFKTGGIQMPELTTCAGALALNSILCASSSAHKLQVSNNNGSFSNIMTDASASIPDSALSAQVALLNRASQTLSTPITFGVGGTGTNLEQA